jgi:hypothetical protein
MEKQTKILIGLGAIAAAAYFIYKNNPLPAENKIAMPPMPVDEGLPVISKPEPIGVATTSLNSAPIKSEQTCMDNWKFLKTGSGASGMGRNPLDKLSYEDYMHKCMYEGLGVVPTIPTTPPTDSYGAYGSYVGYGAYGSYTDSTTQEWHGDTGRGGASISDTWDLLISNNVPVRELLIEN